MGGILVVEDEIKVLSFLTEALQGEGYTVHPSSSVEEAESFLNNYKGQIEVMILDRMLHRTDSITFISKVKSSFPKVRILILSTINTPAQKAAALDLGADDYLSKPFSLVELSARIRSLMRRAEGAAAPSVVFVARNLTVNALEHRADVDGTVVDLSNKEYLVLLTLIEHPGRVYNKFQFLDKVWNTQFDVESNVVEVTIKNLRKKLESAGSKAEIMSRRNIGYWLEA